jgi:hypothetical protein
MERSLVIKVVGLLKRRPGMTVAEFRDYYESAHSLIGEKYLAEFANRYVRRYLHPFRDASGREVEPDFDVILEVWYPHKDAFEAANALLTQAEVAAEIAADEERLFDRARSRFFLVEERESDLTGPDIGA